VITDFQDGTDQIGMDGFEFTDLTIEAGSVYSEQCAADTIVRRGVEFLFVVQQVQSSDLTDVDFTPYTSSVLQSSSESGDSASYTISDACSGAGGSVGGSSKPQIETIKASPELGIAGTRWVLNPIPGAITSGVSEFDSSRYRMTEKVLASQDCGFVEEFHFNTDGTFEIVRKAKVVAANMAGVSADCSGSVGQEVTLRGATYAYDEVNGTLAVNGRGAYVGYREVANGQMVRSPNEMPSQIIYNFYPALGGGLLLTIDSGFDGWWSFLLKRTDEATVLSN
jgi:hypothetical protein